jgi:membrane associated rhomboid family serine protease
LVAMNFAVYTLTGLDSSSDEVLRQIGFTPARHEPVTVFTSMFLHANIAHILGNMFFLWMFGESVEEALGHVVTAGCYVVCGIFATGFYYLANTGSSIPCVGASGAISGMVGLYAVIFPRARMALHLFLWRIHLGKVETNSVGAVGAWLGEQALLGVFARATGLTFGVAFLVHVGGLLAGIGLGFALTRSGFPSRYRLMTARKGSRLMICPACGTRGPRRPAGRYTCKRCRSKVVVDEAGNLEIAERAEAKPPLWIVVAVFLVVMGWVAAQFYRFATH